MKKKESKRKENVLPLIMFPVMKIIYFKLKYRTSGMISIYFFYQASSKLLINYPEKQRSEALDFLFKVSCMFDIIYLIGYQATHV